MKSTKWLLLNIFFTILLLLIVISLNFSIDTYGMRFSLFGIKKNDIGQIKSMESINQHIFKPEYVFRNPNRFDSFIFGSSFTGLIDPVKISSGKFYNMSYSLGLPSQHLAIIKAFLQKGVKIKTVIVGLDNISFNLSSKQHEKQLERIMHPSITGRSLSDIFSTFYFRVPKLFELGNGIKLLFNGERRRKLILNENGLHLLWIKKEKQIELLGKPLFTSDDIKVSPITFDKKLEGEAFAQIQELILLAKKNNFRLIFFFNPLCANLYMSHANALFPVKQKLAYLTDYYDFSGLNSITLNNINYYEGVHYRYLVGDMIIKRIFDCGNINIPGDFGVLVTKKNVNEHIKKQKRELEKYLGNKNPADGHASADKP